MKKQTLSVFVDESGVLSKDDPTSRFYIVTLVTHDQSFSIAELAKRLDRLAYGLWAPAFEVGRKVFRRCSRIQAQCSARHPTQGDSLILPRSRKTDRLRPLKTIHIAPPPRAERRPLETIRIAPPPRPVV